MSEIGKSLVVLGLAIAAVGIAMWSGIGRTWFGRLPGDIHIRRGNTEFYFPVVTCVLVSIVISLVSLLFRRR